MCIFAAKKDEILHFVLSFYSIKTYFEKWEINAYWPFWHFTFPNMHKKSYLFIWNSILPYTALDRLKFSSVRSKGLSIYFVYLDKAAKSEIYHCIFKGSLWNVYIYIHILVHLIVENEIYCTTYVNSSKMIIHSNFLQCEKYSIMINIART